MKRPPPDTPLALTRAEVYAETERLAARTLAAMSCLDAALVAKGEVGDTAPLLAEVRRLMEEA